MDITEIIELSALDTLFFGQYYFPRTIRQDSPAFHAEICAEVDMNVHEKIALKVFRGGAKTTLARVIMAKRISFALSRTLLVVSETAEHSIETVKWIKHAMEREDHWSRDFGLVRGDKYDNPNSSETYTWRDDKIQIINTRVRDDQGRPMLITVVGTGIFGQSRGLNIEDYRPDFILLDDVVDEDNAKTPEQRKKVNDRIYGAIMNTLAPRSEAPTSLCLFLQTPLHMEDAIELSAKDPEWKHMAYSCFDERGESRWPARFSTESLRKKKEGFIARNMLSLWMREMEVTITSNELAYFVWDWLSLNQIVKSGYVDANEWDDNKSRLPRGMKFAMGVDPTPPPKEEKQRSSQDLMDLDNAVIQVIGTYKGHVYDMEAYRTKSPNPVEFITKILELARRWNVSVIGFESILFARTTKFYLEQAMMANSCYFRIEPIEDKRKKSLRIRQTLTELFFTNRMHVRKNNIDLISEYQTYPDVKHDDNLDALSIALMALNPTDIIEGEFEDITEEEYLALEDWRGCPTGDYYG